MTPDTFETTMRLAKKGVLSGLLVVRCDTYIVAADRLAGITSRVVLAIENVRTLGHEAAVECLRRAAAAGNYPRPSYFHAVAERAPEVGEGFRMVRLGEKHWGGPQVPPKAVVVDDDYYQFWYGRKANGQFRREAFMFAICSRSYRVCGDVYEEGWTYDDLSFEAEWALKNRCAT